MCKHLKHALCDVHPLSRLLQIDGHMDYMTRLDDILTIIGVKTKPRPAPEITPEATLRGWVKANDIAIYHRNYAVLADGIEEIIAKRG